MAGGLRRFGARTFASFAVVNYRRYFAGALVSNIGTWMQRTCQDWLVLVDLTDHSSTALGQVTALQFVAMPFLAPWAGAVVDRFSKRSVLRVTQGLLGLNALWLWALVATHAVALWQVYLFALTQGVIISFDTPARQAFVSEMVHDDLIANAVGMNSMSFNAARIIGPGLAGLLIAAFGVGPGMLVNALSFAAMLAALSAMDTTRLHPPRPRRGRGATREGLSYVWHHREIGIIFIVVFMVGTFGMNFQITNATMATKVFGRGAAQYGALGTIMAIGTLGAAVIAARRRHPRVRTLMIGLAGFTVFDTVLALAPNYYVYAFFLIPTGLCALTVLTCANSAVQLASAPQLRGRVLALYSALVMGGTLIGAPIVGRVGDVLGPRYSLLVGSVATGLTVAGVLIHQATREGLRFDPHEAPGPPEEVEHPE